MTGRRRKSGAKDLIGLPWQFSAGLALASFAGIRWLLPACRPACRTPDRCPPSPLPWSRFPGSRCARADPAQPLAIVQCKAWNSRQVGVKEIRELLGVMVHEKVGRGIFVTTGSYSADALAFGAANPIQLLDGPAFLGKILDLPADRQAALLAFAFAGDFHTPSCASCGVKMVARASRRGAFWGCMHYPRCKTTLPMRSATS